ncbi:MAG: response regulator [Deltaproteobacteria bacterium]|nr:MAG: response regulator [Deltaproteobacteria bacterium]
MTQSPKPERYTALVVDDEELARHLLREMLGEHPEVEVVAECANGFEAVKAVGQHQPDVLFLDICMPKLDGFEVLDLLEEPPMVVFVTAFDEYAVRAFDAHAVDYLLKPFSEERLAECLSKIDRQRQAQIPSAQELQLATLASEEEPFLQRLVIKEGRQIHILPVDQIDYIEAADDYVSIRVGEATYLKHQTLGSLEKALNPNKFVRIHRSHLLQLDRLARIEPLQKDRYVARLHDGTQLGISRSGYQKLKAVLQL